MATDVITPAQLKNFQATLELRPVGPMAPFNSARHATRNPVCGNVLTSPMASWPNSSTAGCPGLRYVCPEYLQNGLLHLQMRETPADARAGERPYEAVKQLKAVVRGWVDYDPEERYADMATVVRELLERHCPASAGEARDAMLQSDSHWSQ